MLQFETENDAVRYYSVKIEESVRKLKSKFRTNYLRKDFHESKAFSDSGLISINKKHDSIKVRLGWGNVIVETQAERTTFLGFRNSNTEIDNLIDDNELLTESEKVHRDAMIFGTSYVMVANGDTENDEPDVLITAESPLNCWGDINARSRKLDNFMKIVAKSDSNTEFNGEYYDKYIRVVFSLNVNDVTIESIEEHDLNCVPAVRFVNKPSGSNSEGHSELSQSIISMIYSAQESLTEAAVARTIYAAPHRYILNLPTELENEDGSKASIDMYMRQMLVLTDGSTVDDEGNVIESEGDFSKIQIGQFAASDPSSFYKTVPEYARQIQAEVGIPESLLAIPNGINPSSADALRINYKRLLDKCKKRARGFGSSWKQVIKIALLVKNKEVMDIDTYRELEPVWSTFTISTPASDADAVTKLISAGVLPADSPITAEFAGISPDDYLRIQMERKTNANATRVKLSEVVSQVTNSNDALKIASDAMNTAGNFEEF